MQFSEEGIRLSYEGISGICQGHLINLHSLHFSLEGQPLLSEKPITSRTLLELSVGLSIDLSLWISPPRQKKLALFLWRLLHNSPEESKHLGHA